MYTHPLVPIVIYDPNMPPFIPQINLPQEVSYILPLVTSALINEAGQKALSNPQRMVCYNLLSNNGWNNQYFNEILKLTTDFIIMQYRKNIFRTPDQGIQDGVLRILTYYSSDLVFKDNTLKNMCSPENINAAMQNMQAFNLLKNEMMMFYQNSQIPQTLNQFQQPMMPQMGYPNQQPMMPQMGYPNQQPMVPGMGYPNQQPMQQGFQQPYQNSAFSNPGMVPQYPVTASLRSYHNPNQEEPSIKQNAYFTKIPNNSGQTTKTDNVVTSTNVIKEGTEMDRERHTITAFNAAYSFNSDRYNKLAESVDNLTDNYKTEECMHLYESTMFESNFDTAITIGKIKQLERQKEEFSNNVFRIFAIVANPIVSYHNLSNYTEAIKKSDSFNSIASKIKSLVTTLQTKSEKKNYTDAVIAFLNNYDIILTSLVNDFLKNKLRIEVTIESFTTDISELYIYLYKKYGGNYKELIASFENDVIEIILEEVNKDVSEAIKDDLRINNETKNVFLNFIPISYSFTYTFLTNKELQYNDKLPFMVIEEESSPSLYKIANSLKVSKKLKDIPTMYDILITSDNVKYKIYNDISNNKKYFIYKM